MAVYLYSEICFLCLDFLCGADPWLVGFQPNVLADKSPFENNVGGETLVSWQDWTGRDDNCYHTKRKRDMFKHLLLFILIS